MDIVIFIQRRLMPETRRLGDAAEHARLVEWVRRNMHRPRAALVALVIAMAAVAPIVFLAMPWLDDRIASPWFGLVIPLVSFFPVAVFFIFMFYVLRKCTRRGMNTLGYPTCLRCGYDRSGLPPAAVCPECGAAVVSGEW